MSDIFDMQYSDAITSVTASSSDLLSSNMQSGILTIDSNTMLGNSLYNYPSITTNTGPITITNTSITSDSRYVLSSPGNTKLENVEVDGNLKIQGVDIGESLRKIEERLAILHPNTELEEKWENLKELGKMYRELEADILEKEKIYSILKR